MDKKPTLLFQECFQIMKSFIERYYQSMITSARRAFAL